MTEAEFFESKGLPYQMVSMGQMLSSLRTMGSKSAVVAQTESGKFFVGYYDYCQATNIAADIRRVRKFKVLDCIAFKGTL